MAEIYAIFHLVPHSCRLITVDPSHSSGYTVAKTLTFPERHIWHYCLLAANQGNYVQGFFLEETTWRVSLSIGVRIAMIHCLVYLLRIFKMFYGFMNKPVFLFSLLRDFFLSVSLSLRLFINLFIYKFIYLDFRRYSVVGIATPSELDGSGIKSLCRRNFSHLGAHPISCTVVTVSFPGVKRPGHGVSQHLYSTEFKEREELYFCSPSMHSWRVTG
jgi:hypothetical protein